MELHALEGTDRPILPRAELSRIRAYAAVAEEDLNDLKDRMPEELREELGKHLEALQAGITAILDDDGEDGA